MVNQTRNLSKKWQRFLDEIQPNRLVQVHDQDVVATWREKYRCVAMSIGDPAMFVCDNDSLWNATLQLTTHLVLRHNMQHALALLLRDSPWECVTKEPTIIFRTEVDSSH